jgi:anti-anti-sigma regulatory factor
MFSLFGKKAGRGPDRKRAASPETVARTGTSAVRTAGGADPREIARRTAAKIDEIESQMIAPPRRVAAPPAGERVASGLAGNVYVPSGAGAGAAVATAATRNATPADRADPRSVAVPPAARPRAPDAPSVLGDANDGSAAVEIGGSTMPPAFEEAAVLYSNGQAAAAATILWQAIQDPSLGAHSRAAWAMLFDLYLATGRQAEFESLAIDFSARFETSPPAWDEAVAPLDPIARPATGAAPSVVTMPASLDAQAVRQVEQVQRLAQRQRAVLLDLAPVRAVDPIGADLLLRVLAAFARAQRELLVRGADALAALVEGSIEAGRRDPSEAFWLLRLELLRLLGRQQEFEDLSIDYCVTYEVSPPPWEPMPASVRVAPPADDVAVRPVDGGGGSGFSAAPDAFLVEGEMAGRSQEALAALRDFAADRAEVVVDCRRLRRLDFVAAGELLNEVVALRTGGKYLVFRDMNHVVAALLSVMGIPDLAEIRLRRQ